MVVLSAAIVTSGKTLIARQFVEMTRLRIEGLLSAFPKLVDSGRDHTFIETETVRYVYQPMESLFLVLVTNKSSNILEDLETLRLLAKVVQDCCQIQVNEELVLKNAFNIIFAFDEVISFGHRESVTLSQIKTYTEMDSHEEKLHQMIEQSKINEAREMAKKKQMELAKLRVSQPKNEDSQSSDSMAALSRSSMGMDSLSASAGGGNTNTGMDMQSPPSWAAAMEQDTGPTFKPNAPKKGMSLGKKKPADVFAGMGMSDPAPAEAAAAESKVEAAPAPVVNPLLEPVKVEIEEKIAAELQVEGGLQGEVTCTGQFQVTVLDTSKADLVCFKMTPADNSNFKYKVHPNLNKASHANNILEVRDASRAYRANTPAPLVKWQGKSNSEDYLPVSLSCWPSATGDGTQIVLELEMTDTSMTLQDVSIRFPCPPSARPNVTQVEPGEAAYDPSTGEVHWHIPVLDANEGNGTLEFSASTDTATLLPYTFDATRRGFTKCPMDILECYHQEKGDAISYLCEKSSSYSLKCGV
eukprot:TRINITY_DN101482_c0_g1_i1.p1 TRINITY_DN101482_c0_g1~~TRINITY_DN101482_c0_g1_i1.p1  ORF type:complete len:526 (+),score=161.86 TRINITY_DN101482_c0_g1_i1:118-1695(+)